MMRKVVAGNWKLNGSKCFVDDFFASLEPLIKAQGELGCELMVIPPVTLLAEVSTRAAALGLVLGSQNVSAYESGAYTGELSAAMLMEAGCQVCIVGHSERRALFCESNADVAQKTRRALDAGMRVIVCVGETLEQRENGETEAFVLGQLGAVLDVLTAEDLPHFIVAYEPVWAIGTGRTASPEQAQEVHRAIRQSIAARFAESAATVPLLYGGSVKGENAEALFAQDDIDGGLIGGASLKAEEFMRICRAAS